MTSTDISAQWNEWCMQNTFPPAMMAFNPPVPGRGGVQVIYSQTSPWYTFNCAWLVHGASRYLVCARAPHMLSPIRRSTRAESIFVLQKAPCFCNRPALYWGDRINIFCASAFFQHCLFCLFPQSSPEYMLHGEWPGPLAELRASLASAWEVGGQQLSSSILLDRNQLECHFFGLM